MNDYVGRSGCSIVGGEARQVDMAARLGVSPTDYWKCLSARRRWDLFKMITGAAFSPKRRKGELAQEARRRQV